MRNLMVNGRTPAEMREDLAAALSKGNLDDALKLRAQERCAELAVERAQVKKSLQNQGEQQWLQGIDNLSVASVVGRFPACGSVSGKSSPSTTSGS